MSKPIQPVDPANNLSITPLAATQADSGARPGISFSSLLPVHPADQFGNPGRQFPPAPGNNLPEQAAQAGSGLQTLDAAMYAVDSVETPGNPQSAVAQFITWSPEVTVLPAATVPGQQLSLSNNTSPSVPVQDNQPGITGQALLPGQQFADQVQVQPVVLAQQVMAQPVQEQAVVAQPVTAQAPDTAIPAAGASIPTVQPAERVSPASVQTIDLQAGLATGVIEQPEQAVLAVTHTPVQAPAHMTEASFQTSTALPEQAFQLSTQVTAAPLPSSGTAVFQPSSAAAQAVDLPAPSLSQANGQPAQSGHPSAEVRMDKGSVPLDAGADVLRRDVATDAGRETALSAAKQFTADDGERASASREPVSAVMRQAIQSMSAGQAGGGELEQSMQKHHETSFGGVAVAAMTRSETSMLSFLQNLSDSSPLALPSARVQTPVGQQGWGREVGQQLAIFVSQDVSAAKLRLNPQHLGPMEMQITLDGDKANVSFLSQHPVVRDALESSLPRLREMLAESGLNLGNVNISQHGSSDQNGRGMTGAQQGMEFLNAGTDADEANIGEDVPQTPVMAPGLIDDYA